MPSRHGVFQMKHVRPVSQFVAGSVSTDEDLAQWVVVAEETVVEDEELHVNRLQEVLVDVEDQSLVPDRVDGVALRRRLLAFPSLAVGHERHANKRIYCDNRENNPVMTAVAIDCL